MMIWIFAAIARGSDEPGYQDGVKMLKDHSCGELTASNIAEAMSAARGNARRAASACIIDLPLPVPHQSTNDSRSIYSEVIPHNPLFCTRRCEAKELAGR